VANETASTGAGILHELFRISLYKRNQGRIARRATFAALAVIVALGALQLSRLLGGYISEINPADPDWPIWKQNLVHYGVPLVVLAAGLWTCFRLVQMPSFADFLISVEGEMNKVSWPSRSELFRASLVVILVIFFLAGILFLYDYALTWIIRAIDSLIESIFG
jgi:preprotein translocase subunit SecE